MKRGPVDALTPQQFIDLFSAWAPDRKPNSEQTECVNADPAVPLMIVAGPGTGKTTVLVLRALRMVLVDRILPEQIVITTFTKKAADEIVTRLIEWGRGIIAALRSSVLGDEFSQFLDSVDINRFITGTLDSICEDALGRDRLPTELPPVVVETFASNRLLARYGNIYNERENCPGLGTYLHRYSMSQYAPNNIADLTKVIRTIVDRFAGDIVDVSSFESSAPNTTEKAAICRIYRSYQERFAHDNRLDFGMLERLFLERIKVRRVPESLRNVRIIMVDEYQDTNPLQELLYFSLSKQTGAKLNVVGDDDQSLFRFRGATMELFRDFAKRFESFQGPPKVSTLYLFKNYRSHPEIVDYCNAFIAVDPEYSPARVQPGKPQISAERKSQGIPVYGLFREDLPTLAESLADLLCDTFRGNGWTSPRSRIIPFVRDKAAGNFGDAVLLAAQVSEFTSGGRERLPNYLRTVLEHRGIHVFNPRGKSLSNVPTVAILLGLVIHAVDPLVPKTEQPIAETMRLQNATKAAFRGWRAAADAFVKQMNQTDRSNLSKRLGRWQSIAKTGKDTEETSAREWPLLDVMYSFITWLPDFQEDPEHQIYLEAISRTAAEAATFSAYRSNIVAGRQITDGHLNRSIQSIIGDVLAPIADDTIEVDEDIMPNVPRNRLSVMTIHQAKGLEFPLTIVDVSSDFKTDHSRQRFWRFPSEPSTDARLEDDLAPFTEIGPARKVRTALDRSFDDIIRKYYVAFSRAQTALLLVGLEKSLLYENAPRNMATSWRRNSTWAWRESTREKRICGPDGKRMKGVKEKAPLEADLNPLRLL